MACERIADERLTSDKMDVLYGEADVETRARLDEHLAACPACREELAQLTRLRKELKAWQRPALRAVRPARPIVVPRWLAAAAALLLGVGIGLGASGYFSLRRALARESERAARIEQRQRETARALETALKRPASAPDAATLLTNVEPLVDEKLRASEARQEQRLEARLLDWDSRTQAQRRLDLARVAEGLSYLDGRHGQQLARTNELMSYVLAAQKR
jgi:anti-sigma factor RsiW